MGEDKMTNDQIINQQRERIVLMQRLKRESDSVLGPVLDYCRDNGIGEIGKSMTQALIAEHSSQRELIAELEQKLIDSVNAHNQIFDAFSSLEKRAQSAEQRVKELERIFLNKKVVDWVRCGIGANYSGDSYEELIREFYVPMAIQLRAKLGGE